MIQNCIIMTSFFGVHKSPYLNLNSECKHALDSLMSQKDNLAGPEITIYLIQFRLACMMFHQYHHSRSILLKPPIQFGNHTSHFTRTQPHFVNPYRCRLSQTQKFFRCTGTTNWNNLPLNLKQTESFSEFYKAAKYHFLIS